MRRFCTGLFRLAVFSTFFMILLTTTAMANELFNHELRRLHSSQTVNVQDLVGEHPVLVVNTASHCGFTGQFEGLEALHQRYQEAGLRVIGFSSNDFRQEAADESVAADICFVNYGVTFAMFAPIHVRGPQAHPIFRELTRQSHAPRWNFYKYLVNREGQVVEVFSSMTSPDSPRLRAAIEAVL